MESVQRRAAVWMVLAIGLASSACSGPADEPVRVQVPRGASFGQVADTLAQRGVIRTSRLFRVYGRVRGVAGGVKPGTYEFEPGTSWSQILDDLIAGRVLTARVAVPEAWDLRGIAPRIAAATGLDADSVLGVLADTATANRFGVPGPTMEGYLYPATYTFPVDAPLDTVIAYMAATYQRAWTPERRARADSIGLNEREVVTLASIIEKEARQRDEMPTISGVYHNRLRRNWRLEADPTVQYALGEHQQRLLYAHIDDTADSPYNTYRIFGLPPGPIGSPSAMGIDAALYPATVDYMFFVARPDGSHVFTRTLDEHNRARAAVRRMRDQAGGGGGAATPAPAAAPAAAGPAGSAPAGPPPPPRPR
jgi:UPF0755 protein